MPTYLYICPSGHRQEAVRKIDARDECPPCRCGLPTERRITATMVSVFSPYMTVAHDKETGKPMMIRTRDEHRAFLTRNGYEEVGNDASMAPLPAEEVRYRRKIKLKEEEEARSQPDFEFDPCTHEAFLPEQGNDNGNWQSIDIA